MGEWCTYIWIYILLGVIVQLSHPPVILYCLRKPPCHSAVCSQRNCVRQWLCSHHIPFLQKKLTSLPGKWKLKLSPQFRVSSFLFFSRPRLYNISFKISFIFTVRLLKDSVKIRILGTYSKSPLSKGTYIL